MSLWCSSSIACFCYSSFLSAVGSLKFFVTNSHGCSMNKIDLRGICESQMKTRKLSINKNLRTSQKGQTSQSCCLICHIRSCSERYKQVGDMTAAAMELAPLDKLDLATCPLRKKRKKKKQWWTLERQMWWRQKAKREKYRKHMAETQRDGRDKRDKGIKIEMIKQRRWQTNGERWDATS